MSDLSLPAAIEAQRAVTQQNFAVRMTKQAAQMERQAVTTLVETALQAAGGGQRLDITA